MKIYQIHKYTSDYEDFHDFIVESYADERLAKIRLNQFLDEVKEIQSKVDKCNGCPIFDYEHDYTSDESMNLADHYCDNSNVYVIEGTKDDLGCLNYCNIWDYTDAEASYVIKEVEILSEIPR